MLPLYAIEEERKIDCFSPEFNFHACESQVDGEVNYLGSPACSPACLDSPPTRKENLMKPAGKVESHCNGVTWRRENSNGDLNQIKPVAGKEKDQVSVADFLCTVCKQLLFRPVVLNCGHGIHVQCFLFKLSSLSLSFLLSMVLFLSLLFVSLLSNLHQHPW